MRTRRHDYAARLVWTGNRGLGTAHYDAYAREYRVLTGEKPELTGSADAAFRGDARRHNPEDLFLAAISGCHLLSYLALCARHGVCVVAYEDEAEGTLELNPAGGGQFTSVLLRPRVTIDDPVLAELAMRLHDVAHEQCFIAASCRVPIRHRPTIDIALPRVAGAGAGAGAGSSAPRRKAMLDLAIDLEQRPGALADMGEALGRAGVSIEGGGAFVVGHRAVAHFLFTDGPAARQALESAGIRVQAQRPVLVRRLKQDQPGELGRLARRLGDAGVNIEVVYSDHANQLILVLDDAERGAEVTREWEPGLAGTSPAP